MELAHWRACHLPHSFVITSLGPLGILWRHARMELTTGEPRIRGFDRLREVMDKIKEQYLKELENERRRIFEKIDR